MGSRNNPFGYEKPCMIYDGSPKARVDSFIQHGDGPVSDISTYFEGFQNPFQKRNFIIHTSSWVPRSIPIQSVECYCPL